MAFPYSIWIVHGQYGEYDDDNDWVVSAYREEAAAEAAVARLNVLAKASKEAHEQKYKHRPPHPVDVAALKAAEDALQVEDPGNGYSYRDVTYWCESIKLR